MNSARRKRVEISERKLTESDRCCLYPQHEHISRVSFLVCLSVFACTLVHSNSLTISTDSLACIAGALTKQLSVLLLSKHVSHTCLTLSSNTCVFHSGSGARVAFLECSAEPAADLQKNTEVPEVPPQYVVIDYGLADMEPKSERMSLPQLDGDPSGWRDYQQEVRLYKTGENLEVNWSVAARLVGGLRGAARRVGLAMTDQELLPTARNIIDNLERRADRNRRGIEALMTRLEAELGQQRPQKKGESLEMFFVSNKL